MPAIGTEYGSRHTASKRSRGIESPTLRRSISCTSLRLSRPVMSAGNDAKSSSQASDTAGSGQCSASFWYKMLSSNSAKTPKKSKISACVRVSASLTEPVPFPYVTWTAERTRIRDRGEGSATPRDRRDVRLVAGGVGQRPP